MYCYVGIIDDIAFISLVLTCNSKRNDVYLVLSGKAKEINLNGEELQQLETWVRASTIEHRLEQRARIVLESAAGSINKDIARRLAVRPATRSGECCANRHKPAAPLELVREHRPTICPEGRGYRRSLS